MKFLRITIIAMVLSMVALSCKSQYDALLMSNDVDAKYKAAFEYFNAGKYQKSVALFESLSVLTDRTERDDTVQFYWGLSNYRYKDYYSAEASFAKFIQEFPQSTFTEEARFLRIDCLYRSTLRYELDAKPTHTAIQEINEYMKDYPDNGHVEECTAMLKDLGERLDRKAFEGARLYYQMEYYNSAKTALKNVLKDDSDNIYREDILYYIAMSSYRYASLSIPSKQRDRYLAFIDDYLNFIGENPDSHYRKELDGHYAKVQKILGR